MTTTNRIRASEIVADPNQARDIWADSQLSPDERINALIAVMTDAEKIAQLGGYWSDERDGDDVIAPMQDVMSDGRPKPREGIG